MKQDAVHAKGDRALEAAVGQALKQIRTSERLTLTELAQASGVSATMISKIERGQVSASLSTLQALASTIGVPIANFFASTVERKEISYVPAGNGIEVRRAGSTYGHRYRQIGSASSSGAKVESFLITLTEQAVGQPVFMHPGLEFIHMLEGQMNYRIGDEEFQLSAGDSITFDSDMPHGPFEIFGDRVQFLTIIFTK